LQQKLRILLDGDGPVIAIIQLLSTIN
jgi:hypothetical protein